LDAGQAHCDNHSVQAAETGVHHVQRVQRIYWELNGTAKKLREARLPHNYERSAQVLDVVLCYDDFNIGDCKTVDNFLCTHNRFENPQYIIDNEHVTLLTFTEHDAVFCEAKEKGRGTFEHGGE